MRALAFVALCGCVHREPAPPPSYVPPPVATRPPVIVTNAPPPPPPTRDQTVEVGNATWYGKRLAGHRTASGERFDPSQMTAAHKTLPLGTWVEVHRTGTNKSVVVRINDRGPFGTPDKIIDLSSAAFERLGSIREGVIPVEVRVLPR